MIDQDVGRTGMPVARYHKPEFATQLIVPYHKAEWRNFYFDGGVYTLEVAWCSWRCQGCWSGYGRVGRAPKYELTPAQVVAKMLAGIERRDGCYAARISSGEPALWWAHVNEVARIFLRETRDLRKVGGDLRRGGEPLRLVIETNGSAIDTRKLDELDREFGKDAFRVMLHMGLKATSAERLSQMNKNWQGNPAAAEAPWARMMRNLEYVCEHTHLDVAAQCLDKLPDGTVLSDPDELEVIRDLMGAARERRELAAGARPRAAKRAGAEARKAVGIDRYREYKGVMSPDYRRAQDEKGSARRRLEERVRERQKARVEAERDGSGAREQLLARVRASRAAKARDENG